MISEEATIRYPFNISKFQVEYLGPRMTCPRDLSYANRIARHRYGRWINPTQAKNGGFRGGNRHKSQALSKKNTRIFSIWVSQIKNASIRIHEFYGSGQTGKRPSGSRPKPFSGYLKSDGPMARSYEASCIWTFFTEFHQRVLPRWEKFTTTPYENICSARQANGISSESTLRGETQSRAPGFSE